MKPAPKVLYRERQLLRAADLRAGQEYLLGLAGRHVIGPHEFGIVRGLGVSVDQGNVKVAPGLAVDGYGRELVVFNSIQQSLLPNVQTQFIYLYYGERPQGCCGDAPNPRWRDSAEVTVIDERWPIPQDEPDVSTASAAGTVPGSPPWPILLAVINNGHVVSEDQDLHFTRIRASRVASPSGRTVMRIGQESLADPYHFLVSTQDAQSKLQNRLAIDRDGNSLLWENLSVTGFTRSVIVPSLIQGVSIKAAVRTGAGGGVRWRTAIDFLKNQQVMQFSFRSKAVEGKPIIAEEFVFDPSLNSKERKKALSAFNKTSKLVKLTSIGRAPRRRKKAAQYATASQPSDAMQFVDDRESPIEYEGGALSFVPERVGERKEPCGCRDEVESPEKLPEGVVFHPGPAPKVPSRDIYCIRVSKADEAPRDEVRASGGAFKEGDFSRRITVCDFKQQLQPWLTVRGNGNVELIGAGQVDATQKLFPMIDVKGRTELPPIKPDPRDPLFNYLLVLSFIYGALTPGSSFLNVTFPDPPELIETGLNWSYNLSVQNLSVDTVELLQSPEIIRAENYFLPRTIPQNLFVPIAPRSTAASIVVPHTPNDIPPGAVKLAIEVNLSMKAGSKTVAGRGTSHDIPVVKSPEVDFTAVPAVLHPGDNFPLAVINHAGQPLTVQDVEVSGLSGPNQHLLTAALPVPANTTVPAPTPVTLAMNQPLGNTPMPVRIDYTWDQTSVAGSLSFTTVLNIP
jgi:hypothetical protein